MPISIDAHLLKGVFLMKSMQLLTFSCAFLAISSYQAQAQTYATTAGGYYDDTVLDESKALNIIDNQDVMEADKCPKGTKMFCIHDDQGMLSCWCNGTASGNLTNLPQQEQAKETCPKGKKMFCISDGDGTLGCWCSAVSSKSARH